MARLTIRDKKKRLSNDEVLVNGNRIPKLALVQHLTAWAKDTFVFQNGTVHLPYDCKMPIENVNDELTNLDVFEKTQLKALDYLITCILAIGIKIGKEIAEKEYNDNREE